MLTRFLDTASRLPSCGIPVYTGEFSCGELAGGLCGEISDNLNGSLWAMGISLMRWEGRVAVGVRVPTATLTASFEASVEELSDQDV